MAVDDRIFLLWSDLLAEAVQYGNKALEAQNPVAAVLHAKTAAERYEALSDIANRVNNIPPEVRYLSSLLHTHIMSFIDIKLNKIRRTAAGESPVETLMVSGDVDFDKLRGDMAAAYLELERMVTTASLYHDGAKQGPRILNKFLEVQTLLERIADADYPIYEMYSNSLQSITLVAESYGIYFESESPRNDLMPPV